MIDTLSQYQLSCTQYERHLNDFRKRKAQNFKEEFQVREKGKLDWDEISQQDNQTIKSLKKKNNPNYAAKMQPANNQKFDGNIIVLDLSNARLSHINEQFSVLKQLQFINLANNLLIEIPQSLLFLPLVHINVNNNLLKSLSIGEVWKKSLERIDIGRNHIRTLPDELFFLEKLQMIDIRSNDFNKISTLILNLQNKLCGLGLDWVRYSHDKYYPNRKDILVADELYRFWEIVSYLYKTNPDLDAITCHDFLTQNEKWDDEIVPEPIKAQQPKQSLITRATQKNFELTLQESYLHYSPLMSYKTQCIDNESLNGSNLMHICVKNEDLGILRTLLNSRYYYSQQLDDDDQTPLSLAINEEKYHCAKILINSNVDVNIGGGQYGSVINLAVAKMQYYLVRDVINQKVQINKQDKRGNGPLHYLMPLFKRSIGEATKIGYLLIESGANPNLFNMNHNTPLHMAIKKSQFSAVKFLIQANEKYGMQIFNFKLLGHKQNSILHLAAKSENIKIILQLYPLNPFLLFTYNTEQAKPLDIVQKNFTLSKLLQVLELIYVKENILKSLIKKQERIVQSFGFDLPQSSQKENSWNLNDSDDERHNLNLDMMNFQMQPRLKRSNSQITTRITTNSAITKYRQNQKISKEDIDPIIINRSIQQGRNNIKWIEKQNSLNKQQDPNKNFNKNIHKILNDINYVNSLLIEISDVNQRLPLLYLQQHYQKQIDQAIQDPLLKMLIESAQELLQFKFSSDSNELEESKKNQVDIQDNLFEQFDIFQQQ